VGVIFDFKKNLLCFVGWREVVVEILTSYNKNTQDRLLQDWASVPTG